MKKKWRRSLCVVETVVNPSSDLNPKFAMSKQGSVVTDCEVGGVAVVPPPMPKYEFD
jgi:hypothetical protein